MHNIKALILALIKSRLFIPGVALLAVFLVASHFMSGGGEGDAGALSDADKSDQAAEVTVADGASTSGDPSNETATLQGGDMSASIDGVADNPGVDTAEAGSNSAERPEYARQPLPKPSFNCAIAGLEAEKLICGSAELARLDVELAKVYDRTVSRAREHDRAYGSVSSQVAFITLVQDQRSWIQRQRNRCRTEQCLSSAYQMRINYLSGYSFR